MTFGERLSELRKEIGYSRVDFAEKIGVPQTTLRNYELGVREPGHEFVVAMAKEFSVSTDYLLGLSDERQHRENREDPSLSALISLFNQMDDDERDSLLGVMRAINKSK